MANVLSRPPRERPSFKKIGRPLGVIIQPEPIPEPEPIIEASLVGEESVPVAPEPPVIIPEIHVEETSKEEAPKEEPPKKKRAPRKKKDATPKE